MAGRDGLRRARAIEPALWTWRWRGHSSAPPGRAGHTGVSRIQAGSLFGAALLAGLVVLLWWYISLPQCAEPALVKWVEGIYLWSCDTDAVDVRFGSTGLRR